jgi:hypothetical protein
MAAFCGGSCYFSLLAASVFAVGAVFFVIGALGPQHSWAHHHPIKTCVVENGYRHVLNPQFSLVDKTECSRIGKSLDLETERNKQYYPLDNILFYVQIPFLQDQIMSRKFHFVVTDLAVHLNNDFAELIMKHDMNTLFLEVVLGYRDSLDGKWQRLAQGNITRTLTCRRGDWNLQCDHVQLFELGSVHHKQYLVNFAIPYLPLSTVDHFRGIAPLSKLALYVIHQTIRFTELWFTLKCILFPVSLITTCWLLWRLAGKLSPSSLTDRCLLFLCITLTAYNAPVEMLALYIHIPWMLVVDDFRQGLLIAALFFFWIVLVGEHTASGGSGGVRSLGNYWKQLLTVTVSSFFMFIYEFCERGVQTVYPFYSLWSNWVSQTVAVSFSPSHHLLSIVYLSKFYHTSLPLFLSGSLVCVCGCGPVVGCGVPADASGDGCEGVLSPSHQTTEHVSPLISGTREGKDCVYAMEVFSVANNLCCRDKHMYSRSPIRGTTSPMATQEERLLHLHCTVDW